MRLRSGGAAFVCGGWHPHPGAGEHAPMPGLRCTLFALLLLLSTACSTLRYDLASVPYPVVASAAAKGAVTQPFTTTGKSVLWVHGLFGDSQPDVAALMQAATGPCAGVANFRCSAGASFHDWLVAHLTLGLVRMKTVTISGDKVLR